MITLVTPVGTSLFTNYLDKNPNSVGFEFAYNTIKKLAATEWDSYGDEIDDLRCACFEFIVGNGITASAELQSIAKIQDKLSDQIKVHLLASDTIASRLAAEILEEQTTVLGNQVSIEFEAEKDVIKGLQIKNTEIFSNRGMPNLMRRISQFDGQLVINITGGYKATVPHLTILSQVDQIPLFYTFEDLDADSPDLIRIPQIPLSVDWQFVQYYADVFSKIDEGIENWAEFKKEMEKNYITINDLRGCIEVADNIAAFSWFGERFWKRYKNHYLVEINPKSYSDNIKVWHGIDTAIRNLYNLLNSALSPDAFKDPECFKTISKLGEDSNLNHGGKINDKTFIFKTQRRRNPIRFAYSFKVDNKEVTSITIFDILREPFNHKVYIKNFKKAYQNTSSIQEVVTLTLPKPV